MSHYNNSIVNSNNQLSYHQQSLSHQQANISNKLNKYRQIIKQNVINKQSTTQPIKLKDQLLVHKTSINEDDLNNNSMASLNTPSFSRSISTKRVSKHKNNNDEQQIGTIQKSIMKDRLISDNFRDNDDKLTKRKQLISGHPYLMKDDKHKLIEQQGFISRSMKGLLDVQSKTNKKSITKYINSQSTVQLPKFGCSSSDPILHKYSFYQDQVKILVLQNEKLTDLLHEKVSYITKMEKQLQSLHQGVSGTLQSQFDEVLSENSFLKSKNQQHIATLCEQISKLNVQLIEKQESWSNRVNMIRKCNLEEYEELNKRLLNNQERLNNQIDQLKQVMEIQQNNFLVKQLNWKSQLNEKDQLLQQQQRMILSKQSSYLQEKMVIIQNKQQQRSILQHECKDTLLRLQIFGQQRQKQHLIIQEQMQGRIYNLQGEIQKLIQQLRLADVKNAQARSKLLLQLRQQKQNSTTKSTLEIGKLKAMGQEQLKVNQDKYNCLIEQLDDENKQLKLIIQTKSKEIRLMCQRTQEARSGYNLSIRQKQEQISRLHQLQRSLILKHENEIQMMKIKIATLSQANISTISQIYSNQIGQLNHLLKDKDQMGRSMADKLVEKMKANVVGTEIHHQQISQLLIVIEKLNAEITAKQLQLQNLAKVHESQKQIISENMRVQSEFYEKSCVIKQDQVKKLTILVQEKDREIEELQSKLLKVKEYMQQEVNRLKQRIKQISEQSQYQLAELRQNVEYYQKQLNKKSTQLKQQKQYYSGQLRQLKYTQDQQLQRETGKVGEQNSMMRIELGVWQERYRKLKAQYDSYKELWNEEKVFKQLQKRQMIFRQTLQTMMEQRQQQMTQYYDHQINDRLKPKIIELNQIIRLKEEEINDMKTNYATLQNKFQSRSRMQDSILRMHTENNQIERLKKLD